MTRQVLSHLNLLLKSAMWSAVCPGPGPACRVSGLAATVLTSYWLQLEAEVAAEAEPDIGMRSGTPWPGPAPSPRPSLRRLEWRQPRAAVTRARVTRRLLDSEMMRTSR